MEPASSQVRTLLADRDVPCPGCGYNLRGLAGAQCPECGRELALTELLDQARVRLGKWFWGGIALDAGLIVWCSLRLAMMLPALEATKRMLILVLMSVAFTSVFVLLVYFRRQRLDAKTFAGEMAWAIWVPLFFKLTCMGGMLFGGV